MFDIPPYEKELPEGQVKVFKEIWDEREHKSFVSGTPLNYNFNPKMFFVFSHVLSKGACPALKLDKRFIVLMTLEEHEEWDFRGYDCTEDKWKPVWALYEEAKKLCDADKQPEEEVPCVKCGNTYPWWHLNRAKWCEDCQIEKT